VVVFCLVEITATQKEATGLAHHFAARFAHLRAAIRAIAGNIHLLLRSLRLKGRRYLNFCVHWIVICHGFTRSVNHGRRAQTEFSGNEFRGNSSAFRYISPEQVFIERVFIERALQFSASLY
jgi:hypothetical protein